MIQSGFLFAESQFTRILYRIELLIIIVLFFAIFVVFIVIIFFFFAIFVAILHVLSDRCPQRIVFREISLSFNILLAYNIVYFSSVSDFVVWYPDKYPPRYHLTFPQCFYWPRNRFWCPSRVQVAKCRFSLKSQLFAVRFMRWDRNLDG